jgi:hypothetical protein
MAFSNYNNRSKEEFNKPDAEMHLCDLHETDRGKVVSRVNTWKQKGDAADLVYLDMRRMYLNQSGEWNPTGKGFSVPLTEQVLDNLQNMIDLARGMLPKTAETTKSKKPVEERYMPSNRAARMTGSTRREREEHQEPSRPVVQTRTSNVPTRGRFSRVIDDTPAPSTAISRTPRRGRPAPREENYFDDD